MSLPTISTTPSLLFQDSLISPQKDTAQIASFAGSSTIFNTSTLGSIKDICIGPSGYLYALGSTSSLSFPTVNGYDNTLDGATDCFVMKMNRTDGSILYASLLGGSDSENAKSLDVDDAGSIYVLGLSNSEDFPLVNPYNSSFNQTSQYFLTKFTPDGQALVYSTFFGAEFRDGLNSANFKSLVVDESGNAYLAGSASNSNVPIVNAFDDTYNGDTDCYILKLNPDGSEIVYASFFGTSYPDAGDDIFCVDDGNIYLTGTTSIYPTGEYYYSGPDWGGHCFVLKISDNGTLLDSGHVKSADFFPWTLIVVDSQHSIYILEESFNSFSIHKFDTAIELMYTKTMHWANFTSAQAITIDPDGLIYIAGRTFDETLAQNSGSMYSGEDDCFIICINSDGNTVFSTLHGTPLRESTKAIAVDENGHVFLAGITTELLPWCTIAYSSFIISIDVSYTKAVILNSQVLLFVGSIGIVALIIFILAYRKYNT